MESDWASTVLFFALGAESGYLEDRLTSPKRFQAEGFSILEGILGGKNVLVVRTGTGYANARRVAEAVLLAHRPRQVISAGFAGGLVPEWKRQELFFPSEVCDEHLHLIRLENWQPEEIPEKFRHRSHFGGRLLTWPGILATREMKEAQGKAFLSQAVDMETFAIAEVCEERCTKFFSVRIISDEMERSLPEDMGELMEQGTFLNQVQEAWKLFWKRPGSLVDLYRLRESAVESAVELADFLEDYLTSC
ncbi:MAG: hypothetical protein Q4D62_10860 [Planctomycetia bacterium]|nr:hypothetical protein [Planctomycetia bacterium]